MVTITESIYFIKLFYSKFSDEPKSELKKKKFNQHPYHLPFLIHSLLLVLSFALVTEENFRSFLLQPPPFQFVHLQKGKSISWKKSADCQAFSEKFSKFNF